MSRNVQYQPTKATSISLSSAQEVHYNKEFKQADIAGGYRERKLRQQNKEK